jgi:hypothetical protein
LFKGETIVITGGVLSLAEVYFFEQAIANTGRHKTRIIFL